MSQTDQSVPDIDWWFSPFAEFEDFVGISAERVEALCAALQQRGLHEYLINRLRKANHLPHGPCNAKEDPHAAAEPSLASVALNPFRSPFTQGVATMCETQPRVTDDFLDYVEDEVCVVRKRMEEPFHSAHEGLGVLLESMEDLKLEVFARAEDRNWDNMLAVCLQIAALSCRFAQDVIEPHLHPEAVQ